MTEAIDVACFERIAEYLTQTGVTSEPHSNTVISGDTSHWHDDGRRERQCWSVADCDNDHVDADHYVAIRDTTDQFLYELMQSNQTLWMQKAELIVKTHEEQHIWHETQRVGECALVREFRDYACVYQDVDAVDVKTTISKHLKLSGVQFVAGQQQVFSIELFYDPNSKVVRVEGDQMVFSAILQMMR